VRDKTETGLLRSGVVDRRISFVLGWSSIGLRLREIHQVVFGSWFGSGLSSSVELVWFGLHACGSC
jgi:hypothetical protein